MTDFTGGRVPRRRRLLAIGCAATAVGAFIASPTSVGAHGGDYQLDFVASAPETYNHATGGGTYDDRTIGVDKDVVESLEGGDFECGDIVTYLTRVTRSLAAKDPAAETMVLTYVFLADTTGQSGVALVDVVGVSVNYGSDPAGDGPGGTDAAIVDDGGSSATILTEGLNKPAFTKGATLTSTVQVTDLEPGETVIVQVDVLLACQANSHPTGNLQAAITDAKITAPNHSTKDAKVQVGNQTVPFRQLGDIYPLVDTPFTNVGSGGPVPTTTAVSGGLPETGSSHSLDMVQFGMLLASAGLIAVVATRRRAIAHRGRRA